MSEMQRLGDVVLDLARRRWLESALLLVGFAASVGEPLGSETMELEGGSVVTARLDLAVAFMPWGWPTLAALLWAPLVVWRGRSRPGPRSSGGGAENAAALILAGATLLVGTFIAGTTLGAAWGLVATGGVVPGNPEALLLLPATMLALYLLAAALILTGVGFWRGTGVVVLGLVVLQWTVEWTRWPAAEALQRWIAVGRLGPGTTMEAPGMVAGIVLEPEWAGISPAWDVLFWLSISALAAAAAAWRRARCCCTPAPSWATRTRCAARRAGAPVPDPGTRVSIPCAARPGSARC